MAILLNLVYNLVKSDEERGGGTEGERKAVEGREGSERSRVTS